MQYKVIIDYLEQKKVLNFIDKYIGNSTANLALGNIFPKEIDAKVLLSLLKTYNKGLKKLPVFVNNRCAITPKSYEQASHEKVAQWRIEIIQQKSTIIDSTSSIGVDAYYLSQKCNKILVYDADADISSLAAYNMNKLGVKNATFDSIRFENIVEKCDLLFVDPDRRQDGNRTILFDKMSPSANSINKALGVVSDEIMIKLSPLADISLIIKTFNNIRNIYCVSYKSEVKEICVILKSNVTEINIEAIEVEQGSLLKQPKFKEVLVVKNEDIFEYIHIPSPALIKLNITAQWLAENNCSGDDNYKVGFSNSKNVKLCRSFKIIKTVDYKSLKPLFFMNMGIKQIELNTKYSKLKPHEVYKKMRLKPGGTHIGICYYANQELKMAICKL